MRIGLLFCVGLPFAGDWLFLFQKSRYAVGLLFVLFGAERVAQFVSDREIQKTVPTGMPYVHELGNPPRWSSDQRFFEECRSCFQAGESGHAWIEPAGGRGVLQSSRVGTAGYLSP